MATKLSSGQVLRESFDDGTGALEVTTVNGFIQSKFDKITRSDFSSSVEDFTYEFQGGVVGIVRVTYTDSTKEVLVSVEKIL